MEPQTKLEQQATLHRRLLETAREAMQHSWSPHSGFPVGASLLTDTGAIFTGCNIEDRNHAGTICAERTAFVKAVSEGHRSFEAIAVVSEKSFDCWPCGICRQFMAEFGGQLIVIVEGANRQIKTRRLSDLLPELQSSKGSPVPN